MTPSRVRAGSHPDEARRRPPRRARRHACAAANASRRPHRRLAARLRPAAIDTFSTARTCVRLLRPSATDLRSATLATSRPRAEARTAHAEPTRRHDVDRRIDAKYTAAPDGDQQRRTRPARSTYERGRANCSAGSCTGPHGHGAHHPHRLSMRKNAFAEAADARDDVVGTLWMSELKRRTVVVAACLLGGSSPRRAARGQPWRRRGPSRAVAACPRRWAWRLGHPLCARRKPSRSRRGSGSDRPCGLELHVDAREALLGLVAQPHEAVVAECQPQQEDHDDGNDDPDVRELLEIASRARDAPRSRTRASCRNRPGAAPVARGRDVAQQNQMHLRVR